MATSINWATKVISVPQADLTFVSGTLYELDTDAWRLELKDIEDGDGMPFLDTHRHNTEVTIAGITYARFFEIINGYTVEFEDGQYAVRLAGSNNNIFDEGVIVRNQVSIIPTNSAGLISGAAIDSKLDQILTALGELLAGQGTPLLLDPAVDEIVTYRSVTPDQEKNTPVRVQPIKSDDPDMVRNIDRNFRSLSGWIGRYGNTENNQMEQMAGLVGGEYFEATIRASADADESLDTILDHGLGRVPGMVMMAVDLNGTGGRLFAAPEGGDYSLGVNVNRWTESQVSLRASVTSNYALVLL